MAIIKVEDIKKMNHEEKNAKIKELKMELIKSNVTAQKSNGKARQIRKALARLHTFAKLSHSTKPKEVSKK